MGWQIETILLEWRLSINKQSYQTSPTKVIDMEIFPTNQRQNNNKSDRLHYADKQISERRQMYQDK